MAGLAQFGLALVDEEIKWMCRPASDDYRIKAGKFQLGRKKAAALGIADRSGKRRFGRNGQTALSRNPGTGQGPDAEGQDIFGCQRIDRGIHLLQQII